MVREKDDGWEWSGRKETQGFKGRLPRIIKGFLELVRSGQACEVCPTIMVQYGSALTAPTVELHRATAPERHSTKGKGVSFPGDKLAAAQFRS